MRMTPRQSSPQDFAFLHGQWLVRNRRLRRPLTGAAAWDEFDAWYRCWPLLDGIGNIGELHTEDCGPLDASLRFFDSVSRRWNVYCLCARAGTLAPPLEGGFEDGIGRFYGERRIGERSVMVRHTWIAAPDGPGWRRAWSTDGGATWEDNWIMELERVDWPLELDRTDGLAPAAIPVAGT